MMNKSVLIGLDGATFSILDPLLDEGVMPFLKSFVASGVRGELISTPNPQTAQAWPAMMTGRSPGNCGIFDFVRFEARPDGAYLTVTDSRDICCETIWSIASRENRTVTTLNFYGMHPPKAVAGHSVSGFIPFRHLKSAVYPRDLYQKLMALPKFNAKELAMDLDLEKKCIIGLPEEEYENWILLHIRREQQWFEILRYLMTSDPTDLTAIVFDGVDKLQHLCWPFLDPHLYPRAPTKWEAKIRSLCLDYFRQIDGFLGEIVRMASHESQVFIVSDHGFGCSTEVFYINVWLHQSGYLEWTEQGEFDVVGSLTVNRLKNHVALIDWEKTRAYAVTPSSNGIFIRVASDGCQRGVDPSDYKSFRKGLIDSLLAFTDPVGGGRVVRRVQTREEAYPGTQMHLAPDLLLTLRDGGFVSIVNSESPLRARPRPVGTHRFEGIFLAKGSGIKANLRVPSLSILDIAPTILYSLGLAIPNDMEGCLPRNIFEGSFLKQRSVRSSATNHAAEGLQLVSQEGDHSSDDEVLERLRAFGYLE
jgi:predicted AlkP superfamily phosphohydrolase/phosphomutase